MSFILRFFQNLLTAWNGNSIICFDNDSCHIDKESCHIEVLYDAAKSFEGTQSRTKCSSAGNGALMRATVEEVFCLQGAEKEK